MFGNYWVGVVENPLEQWQESPISTVADSNDGVSAQALVFCPPYRRAAEYVAEFVGTHSRQPVDSGINQFLARVKRGSRGRRGFAVPADAGILRVDTLNQRAGVDVTAGLQLLLQTCTFLPQTRLDLAQPTHDCFVIILHTPRVTRDPAVARMIECR